jgi:hypothetical protein
MTGASTPKAAAVFIDAGRATDLATFIVFLMEEPFSFLYLLHSSFIDITH